MNQKKKNKKFLKSIPLEKTYFYKMLNTRLKTICNDSIIRYAYETDDDFINLFSRGRIFDMNSIDYELLEPNNCHWNSCRLWNVNREYMNIVIGYALSEEDNIWYQHTWLIDIDNVLIETTYPFSLYFGYVLTYDECEVFLKKEKDKLIMRGE